MNSNDAKAIKEALQRLIKNLERTKGFVCRYCGKQSLKPHGGKCPYSPHQNKCHEFIKASVDNKKCSATNKSRSILYRLANY